MSKAYDEIMDRIVVNDDMRRRVLQNVEKQMVDGAGTGENQTKNAGMKRQPAENDTKPANNVELQGRFCRMGGRRKETPPHETLSDFQISLRCGMFGTFDNWCCGTPTDQPVGSRSLLLTRRWLAVRMVWKALLRRMNCSRNWDFRYRI